MAPSDKALEDALSKAVKKLFYSPDRDSLSVNMIRSRVQEQYNLDDGFFKSAKWKDRSKSVIKELTVCAETRIPSLASSNLLTPLNRMHS
jgi:hypothetical protein